MATVGAPPFTIPPPPNPAGATATVRQPPDESSTAAPSGWVSHCLQVHSVSACGSSPPGCRRPGRTPLASPQQDVIGIGLPQDAQQAGCTLVAAQAAPGRLRRRRPHAPHRLIKRKLKHIRYRPHLVDGCLPPTGLAVDHNAIRSPDTTSSA
jgi:glucose-6-phosphate dehydrogenase assembly protein OpcA